MTKCIYIFIERITRNTAQTLGESSPPDTEGKETDIIQQQPEVLEYLHIPIPVYPGWSGLCEHHASGFRQAVTQRWIFAYYGGGDGKPCLQFVLHPAEEPQSDDREAWEYLQLVFWAPGEWHWGTSFGWPDLTPSVSNQMFKLAFTWYIASCFITDQRHAATGMLGKSWDAEVQRSLSFKWRHPLADGSDGAAGQLPGWPDGSWAQNLEQHPQSRSREEAHPCPLPHVHVPQQS